MGQTKASMLYHLFEWFKDQDINFPGRGVLNFISFRVLLAMLLSLVITLVFGKNLINMLRRRLIGESVRELGLAGEEQDADARIGAAVLCAARHSGLAVCVGT